MRSPLRSMIRLLPAVVLVLDLACTPSEARFPEPASDSETNAPATAESQPLGDLASYIPVGQRFLSGGHLLGRYEAQILANELALSRLDAWVHSSRMPEGAILVQVHSREAGRAQGPIFGMIKREPGYFPQGDDWEYLVLDEHSRLQARGKLGFCARCHAEAPADGVFLPKEAR